MTHPEDDEFREQHEAYLDSMASHHQQMIEESDQAYYEYLGGLAEDHEMRMLEDRGLTDNDRDSLIDADLHAADDCPF